MEKSEKRLNDLIERKIVFLGKAEKTIIKEIVKTEINILNNYKNAVQSEFIDLFNQIEKLQKQKKEDSEKIKKLFLICQLHGIDISIFANLQNELLAFELKRDKENGILRVAEKLRKFITQTKQ